MSFDQLLYEVTAHYRDRGFPETSLAHLRWTLVAHTRDKVRIKFATAYPGCDKQVNELIGHFGPTVAIASRDEIAAADAVFGFAFGYRMRQWSGDPTDSKQVAGNRIPGVNNAALAEHARQLHLAYGLDLYLQFEIADAIGSGARVECTSQRIDQGTFGVLDDFLAHATSQDKKIGTAVLLAHQHHFERCRLIAKRRQIQGLKPPGLYEGYDPLEAQPRVMSPDEFIVNDFASMAGMV